MLKRMNKLNQRDPFVIDVTRAIEAELNQQDGFTKQLSEDNFFDTCSETVLEYYEKEVGLNSQSAELDDRRSAVMAKWLASNVASLDSIQAIADSWSFGKVRCSYSNLVLSVEFVDKGKPTGLDDLKAAIEEAIPAHIGVDYVIQSYAWDDIKNKTWSQLSAMTWNELNGGD